MKIIDSPERLILADFMMFHETLLEHPPEDRDMMCEIASKDPTLLKKLEDLNAAYCCFKAERIKNDILFMQYFAGFMFRILVELYTQDIIPYFYASCSNMRSRNFSGFSFTREK